MAQSGEVNKDKHVDLEFKYPLVRFDSAQITLRRMAEGDSIGQSVQYHFVHDTLNYRKYQLRAQWEAGYKYELMIPAGAFANVAQEQNDTITATYTASDPAKYATVTLNLSNAKPRARYILQLTNAQGKVQKQIFNVSNGTHKFEFVSPGEVMIRIVEDLNVNGKWDTGDMVARRQPERSEIYKSNDGVELITTKENWEFDLEVDMDVLFAPITMESLVKMLDDREDERLKKLAIDEAKKRQEANKSKNNQNSGMGFGGMGGGAMGGLGGLGGGGGVRSNDTSGAMSGGMGNMRR